MRSEERVLSQVKHVFDSFDVDHSGTIDKIELKMLLEKLEPRVTDNDVEEAVDAMYKHGSREEITFDEFSEWYKHSMIYRTSEEGSRRRHARCLGESKAASWRRMRCMDKVHYRLSASGDDDIYHSRYSATGTWKMVLLFVFHVHSLDWRIFVFDGVVGRSHWQYDWHPVCSHGIDSFGCRNVRA